MSGATLAYNLRRNKYVERQLFMELLARFCRWKDIRDYLYIGFGGVYFEEFKLLHTRFCVNKMISLEREEWMLSRQILNKPYGCITPLPGKSAELVMNVDSYRTENNAQNLLIWLDYVSADEFPTQLSEIRSLVPKLDHADILKVTFSLHSRWLNNGPSKNKFVNRLETLRSTLGSAFLAEGISITDVSDDGLPHVFLDALKRKIAEGLTEVPTLEFVPLGCYLYSDGTPMLTVTGAMIRRQEQADFESRFGFDNSEVNFTSPGWEIHRIAVPDMSLRERIEIDQRLTGKSAEQIATELSFKFEEDDEASLDLIRNYMKLYRFYPNYHRVQI
jgi:hypothetical protein